MKKYIVLSVIISLCLSLYAQTEGLSYQALIINPNSQKLPGVDAQDNILPDTDISIRFTVFNAVNQEEFQEVQNITTDRFGMVNLMIGAANKDAFAKIDWDGTVKDLKVEIDFDGSGGDFVDISRQQLTFIPYAYHRNIKATGTLTVDKTTDLNGVLQVHGMAQLNSNLEVTGQTTLKNRLTANDKVDFKDSLFVDSVATFKGSAEFQKEATFGSSTKFKSVSIGTDEYTPNTANETPLKVFGKVEIDANNDMNANQDNMDNYPLLIKGSEQGLAIQVKGGRSSGNNYVSFWDENANQMWGRIEGQKENELLSDEEFLFEIGLLYADAALIGAELGIQIVEAATSVVELAAEVADVRACVGVGACATTPSVVMIGIATANMVTAIANGVVTTVSAAKVVAQTGIFTGLKTKNLGVSYQSGAGDYAEWLLKENSAEQFIAGELVGVKNGMVSKHIFGADRVMVVSTNPIVLGNMPQEQDESKYEKIAFMGQVPVRVIGEVKPGDYILPNELALGFAKAVHPEKMATRDYKKIVGVAWNTIDEISKGISVVNVAVGINTNDLADEVAKQKEELNTLWAEYDAIKNQMEQSNMALAQLVPGYTDLINVEVSESQINNTNATQLKSSNTGQEPCSTCPENIKKINIEFDRKQVEMGIDLAKVDYQNLFDDANSFQKLIPPMPQSNTSSGLKSTGQQVTNPTIVPMEEHPFWSRINSDPAYKEEIVQFIKTNLEEAIQKQNIDNDSVLYNFNFNGF